MARNEQLDGLVGLSRRYGADPDWVIAGGGNSSWKSAGRLYVKASGSALGSIDEDGFCAIDRNRLAAIWDKAYPADAEAREAAVLSDLMAAREPGETKRPSVETLMHGLFPQAWVLHTHPAIVNGLTCGLGGEEAFTRLFSDIAIWVPFVEPGYLLAKAVREAAEAFRAKTGGFPSVMFMQNHGLLVAADDVAGIDRLSDLVIARLAANLHRRPNATAVAADARAIERATAKILTRAGAGAAILFRSDAEILLRAASPKDFEPLAAAFSPDHIVYAGHEFLRVDDIETLPAAWDGFQRRNDQPPRIVLCRGLGAFSIAMSGGLAAASNAMLLFVDACAVAAYTESFGGARHMSPAMIDFIRHWEVEKYRAKIALGDNASGEAKT